MNMNKTSQGGIVSAFILIAAGCVSTTGPVTIRESVSSLSAEVLQDSSNGDRSSLEQKIALTQPVVPDSQTQSSIPLVERLVEQSNTALRVKNYSAAINLAEQGLRIDRKEVRLYLVLAEAYQGLQNKQQSRHFANQGLRYTQNKQGNTYALLRSLAQ